MLNFHQPSQYPISSMVSASSPFKPCNPLVIPSSVLKAHVSLYLHPITSSAPLQHCFPVSNLYGLSNRNKRIWKFKTAIPMRQRRRGIFLGAWVTSVDINSSGSVHSCRCHFLDSWVKFQLSICALFSLCSHLSIDRGWFSSLAIVNRTVMNRGEQVSLSEEIESSGFSSTSGIDSCVLWSFHLKFDFLFVFWENCRLISKVFRLLCILTHICEGDRSSFGVHIPDCSHR